MAKPKLMLIQATKWPRNYAVTSEQVRDGTDCSFSMILNLHAKNTTWNVRQAMSFSNGASLTFRHCQTQYFQQSLWAITSKLSDTKSKREEKKKKKEHQPCWPKYCSDCTTSIMSYLTSFALLGLGLKSVKILHHMSAQTFNCHQAHWKEKSLRFTQAIMKKRLSHSQMSLVYVFTRLHDVTWCLSCPIKTVNMLMENILNQLIVIA